MEKTAEIAKLIRYYSLVISSKAGSGHPTSSMSATDLMSVLFNEGFFRYDITNPRNVNNDRLIFSKGHASPLFYSLWKIAGKISDKELMTYREFGSNLQGHPTPQFKYADVSTGSLGQGLSIGAGFALNAKRNNLDYKTYVLLGDSEMAEGSVWEAMEFASYYKLSNLVAIVDVNRLGQSRETMLGWDTKKYEERAKSFGFETIVIDGHDLSEIRNAFSKVHYVTKPFMIIAKTIKGKGVSFLENKENWHGKSLKPDDLEKALKEIGKVNKTLTIDLPKPSKKTLQEITVSKKLFDKYEKDGSVATRKAYGNALARIYAKYPNIIALDGETSNSTYSEILRNAYPESYVECFISEQNMVGVALGLSKFGNIPFVSTFSAFFTRAFDQIRMSAYSLGNVKFVGSHAGVSIGEDGISQMGLEDISMFRSIFGSTVFYPSDGNSTDKVVELAAKQKGIVYIRTTRMETPVIYDREEKFEVGGSKTVFSTSKDKVTIVAAGVTLHEAIKAHDELLKNKINVRVIDLYSIKPLDQNTLEKAANETKALIVVEDHYESGGIGEAVRTALIGSKTPIYSLAVRKMPGSGKPEELLDYEDISKRGIIKTVKKLA